MLQARSMLNRAVSRFSLARPLGALALALALGSCSGGGTVVDVLGGLRFVTQPANTTAGQSFVVSVELLNQNGNHLANGTQTVVLSLVGGTGALTGTTSAVAAAGTATFSGVTLNTAGSNLVLVATSGTFTANSASFAVRAAAASGAQSSVTANPSTISINTNTTLSFTFKDQYGNPKASVSVSLSSTLTGATFTPSSGTTGTDGTFQSTFRTTTAGSAPIAAVVDGVTINLTPLTVVDLCAPVSMTFPGSVNGTLSSGSGCIVNGQPTAIYRFTASGSGGTVFTTTAAFPPIFRVRKDPPGDNPAPGSSTTAGTYTGRWLLSAGSYQFWVSAASGSGTWSATGTSDNGVVANCNYYHLISSLTLNGQTLAATDCPLGDGSYYDEFRVFNNQGPCTITMTSTAYAPFLFWATTSGNILNFAGSSSGTTATLNLSSCTASGSTGSIWANSFNAAQTGPYTLVLTLTGGATYVLHDGDAGLPFERSVGPAVPSADQVRAIKASLRK